MKLKFSFEKCYHSISIFLRRCHVQLSSVNRLYRQPFFFCCFPDALVVGVEFFWLEHDKRFDFIVGITVDDRPAGLGSFIKSDDIVTSANPLESYLTKTGSTETAYYDPERRIKVYGVENSWKNSRLLEIDRFVANVSKRNRTWIKMGFDRTHSPIHDLLFIIVRKYTLSGYRTMYDVYNRLNYFQNGWTFAGFGYVDRDHVKNGTLLETHTYEDSEEVDCEEWIPRAWGRFICLLNVDNVIGIQSGAPLMYDGELRGVGCFALKKGKESILVFTDFSLYRQFLEDFIFVPPTTTPNKRVHIGLRYSNWRQYGSRV